MALAGTIKGTRGGSERGGRGELAPEKSNLQGRGPLCVSPPHPQDAYPLPLLVLKQNSLSPTPSSSQGSVSWTGEQMQPEKGPLQRQPCPLQSLERGGEGGSLRGQP